MKRKLFVMALALGLTVSMVGCSDKMSNTTPTSSGSVKSVSNEATSDVAYIKDKGTLIIGMTEFAPMDYKVEGSNEWIGFDADMGKAFASYLGVDAKFIEINWDNKLMELDTKAIDVIWNGMTLTEEVKSGASTPEPYCNNGQVVVLPVSKAANYQTVESLSGLKFAVENGSAGAEQLDELGLKYTALDTQAKALMEVASGASDACVIDLLMAGAMIGEGTSYPNLTYTVQLNSEEYGVAFRKGSDMVDEFNNFWKSAYDDGTVLEIATTYGVQESIIAK